METIVERPAALDVHKARVMACVRVPDRRGRASSTPQVRDHWCAGCWRCATGWLGHGVQQVVMEATWRSIGRRRDEELNSSARQRPARWPQTTTSGRGLAGASLLEAGLLKANRAAQPIASCAT